MIFISFKRKKKKTIINRVLSIKQNVLVVHIILVNLSVMQKLDGMNTKILLKIPNHQNTFEPISTTVLHGLLFQILQKMSTSGITLRNHILLYGNLILTDKMTLKDWFYLEIVTYKAINDIIPTP